MLDGDAVPLTLSLAAKEERYMQNKTTYWLCLIVAFGLISCGKASLISEDCKDTPDTASNDIPNSVALIISDMTLPHEGVPHGVPESYDWAKGPTTQRQSIPERFHAIVAWGQVYEDTCGNPASNTRVQIRDIRIYYLSKRDRQWHLLEEARRVDGAAYRENFAPHISIPGDIRSESDGSISVKAGDGFNFHFFPPGRAEIEPDDVAAIWATAQARLVIDNPSLPDDRYKARYLVNMGADLWRNTTVEFDKDENNPDLGMGRFKYATTGWQAFNMLYMEGGIDENALQENPPPLNLEGG